MEGGTAHGWDRSTDQLVCLWGAPGHVYKGWREEEAGPHRARPKCGVLLGLPSPSRLPPPTWNRKKGREKRRKEGAQPLP